MLSRCRHCEPLTSITSGREAAFPQRRGVRALLLDVAPKEEGAGNAGCTTHPLPYVHNKKTHAGQHRSAEITPALPAQWLYGLLRALPGVPGLLVPVALPTSSTKLGASIGAPGPHGLAVRFGTHRLHESASIAAQPTNRDDRETPLLRVG